MLRKQRTIPIPILMLSALLRRLPHTHPSRPWIEDDLGRREAGYKGELILDSYVKHLPLKKNYYIFQDLRLPISEDDYFQIDTLLLSSCYFSIFEAKHIAGTLLFEELQLIRTLDEEQEAFPNPIVQIENQQYFLRRFMQAHDIPLLPSDALVVVTNPNSIILQSPNYPKIEQKVVRPSSLRTKWEQVDARFQNEILQREQLEWLTQLLLTYHTPEEPDLLKKFDIDHREIIPGIYCEECQQFSVVRANRYWRCTRCQQIKTGAFMQALLDYRLLIAKTITNAEFRKFFSVKSKDVASHILRNLNLRAIGSFRHRKYELDLHQLLKDYQSLQIVSK